MSNHKIACILISAIVILMGYGVTKVRNKAVIAHQASDTARAQAESTEQQKQIAEIKLKSIDSKTAELRKVYKEWLPYFEEFGDTGDGEQRIAEVVRKGDVFLLSQKFKSERVDGDEIVSRLLIAELVVEDEYTKVMNWLGKLEESIPSCRIAKCSITRGDRGNDIHMELRLEVPVISKPSGLAANQ